MTDYENFAQKLNVDSGIASFSGGFGTGQSRTINLNFSRPNNSYKCNLSIFSISTDGSLALTSWVSAQTTSALTVEIREFFDIGFSTTISDNFKIYWEIWD